MSSGVGKSASLGDMRRSVVNHVNEKILIIKYINYFNYLIIIYKYKLILIILPFYIKDNIVT